MGLCVLFFHIMNSEVGSIGLEQQHEVPATSSFSALPPLSDVSHLHGWRGLLHHLMSEKEEPGWKVFIQNSFFFFQEVGSVKEALSTCLIGQNCVSLLAFNNSGSHVLNWAHCHPKKNNCCFVEYWINHQLNLPQTTRNTQLPSLMIF